MIEHSGYKGVKDILPGEIEVWQYIEDKAKISLRPMVFQR